MEKTKLMQPNSIWLGQGFDENEDDQRKQRIKKATTTSAGNADTKELMFFKEILGSSSH